MELEPPLQGLPPLIRLGIYVGVLALAVLALVFLSAAEAALLGFSRVRRRQLVEENAKGIGDVERLLAKPRRYVLAHIATSAILTTVSAAAAVLAGLEAATLTGAPPGPVLLGTALVAVILVTAVGQVLPKAYGARRNERLSIAAAPVLLRVVGFLAPVTTLLERLAERAYKANGGNGDEPGESHFRSEEELKTFVTLGSEEDILDEDEEEMIQSVIELGDTRAREILVPRIDVVGVAADATLEEVKDTVLETGFSRIPVYEETIDNVIGVMFAKELLVRLLEGHGRMKVRALARDAYFVPETMKLDDLLAELQERRSHMAIVVDEFGGTAGIITLEDVIEEIVGEIFDEYDLRSDPLKRLDEDTVLVDARMNVADLNDAVGADIPEDGPYDTVGGFVYHRLGRLGREGESVRADPFDLVVEKVSNRRILAVRVERRPGAPAPEPAESPSNGRARRDHPGAHGSDA